MMATVLRENGDSPKLRRFHGNGVFEFNVLTVFKPNAYNRF
ncbi:hypothetical protein SAMN04488069_1012 [Hymenobacter psychrophilus]|uniref:Uncharacterized protein n=1 Tax=Hymenobacter psychrophilus TaxID=651662 RepID=A0A1H3AQH2_9BACT|nr:hypothetical protein SAMN04488069_1012 [Hymenobacter psychrophilus]